MKPKIHVEKIEVSESELSDFNRRLSEKLRLLREERGLKRDWVARRIGVHYNTLKNWELGKARPGAREILALCKIYHCKPSDIFNGL